MLGLAVGLGRVLGAEFGAACDQGGVFQCRNAGFNDARCITTGKKQGYCTKLCNSDTECPSGYGCTLAVWTNNGVDTGNGRVERVCTPKGVK